MSYQYQNWTHGIKYSMKITLAAHWLCAVARAAAPTRRKIQLFLKILKNCRIEDLKDRKNFHTFGQVQFGLETLQFHHNREEP